MHRYIALSNEGVFEVTKLMASLFVEKNAQ